MKRKYILGAFVATIVLVSIVAVSFDPDQESGPEITAKVQKGEFRIEVNAAGELEAKNSVKILGPNGLRRAQIWQVKIDHIVDEGTVVSKGDYIARLDESEIRDKIQNTSNDLQQSQSKYTQTKLDTALELRKARDELVNLRYAVEEKEIVLSQSQYEPPAQIKQAEINLEKAKRELSQASDNYKLKTQKAVAQMDEAAAVMMEDRNQLNFLESLLAEFTIKAPEPGMVIYKRNWRGEKMAAGSTVEPWDPVVATLPDLSTMVSRTYINEVDINTVKPGQTVNIGLDAFPEKGLTGNILEVANIGEQKPNSDSKVFLVLIQVNETDTTLRPGMTTSNLIVAETIPDALYVPIESIHSQGDSMTYVYKRSGMGITKQEVVVGKSNSDESVILGGLEESETVFLSDPEGYADDPVILLENKSELASSN